ncbi:ATP-dependent DNA helicase [Pedobacter antarcticus]|uniref:ATP-dependent endonuclease n=2 Tax=Pedobacter antarcticus TaxID=34086 RepID=A0A081PL54_9SPHI|nr:AAA family ATPase [Pedobacter antarcticus]KEQ31427.1 ATP-dependent endonuclease [Pedobacter antarcticus 4BY]SDL68099.1 exodeoxyribonuclease-5 [Pedobacter antarcticus]SFE90109.1 exodeoxyribonuclease-5 [Pedobacter antarcticus]
MDNAVLIASSYQYEPTAEQLNFCEQVASFLTGRVDQRCFILRGYAGTGKTTSIAALVKALPRFKMRSVLLAPTGRAAKVMRNYSGRTALTVHKRIYRKRSAVSTEMAFQLAPNLAENTLFIVDEASMIADEWNSKSGSSFLKDIVDYIYNGKNCAVLFVGDTAQLPPVGSLESPALNRDYLAQTFGFEVFHTELKEVVRQGRESGILANASMLRVLINEMEQEDDHSEDKALIPKFFTKGYNDIFRMTGLKMVEGLEYAYRKFEMENTLVVCRSNKSANIYNQQIRTRLLYREEELTGGDQIMIVRNNYFWLPDNEAGSFIANGDMARIVRVRREEERYGFRFAEVQLEFFDYPDAGQITCKVMLDTLQGETPNLSYEDSKKLFEGLSADYEHITNRRERMLAIKADPFYNALQIKFAYAVTCHKAQGGQWDAVFVDQGYLTDDMIDIEFLRWLYTAVTRSRKELFLVNFSAGLFEEAAEDQY